MGVFQGHSLYPALPASSLVPVVQIQTVDRVGAAVRQLLRTRPHGELVHGGVGLSRGVVPRRQTVAGLTAVVAVPVVHGTVLVIQSCNRTINDKRGRVSEAPRVYM